MQITEDREALRMIRIMPGHVAGKIGRIKKIDGEYIYVDGVGGYWFNAHHLKLINFMEALERGIIRKEDINLEEALKGGNISASQYTRWMKDEIQRGLKCQEEKR